MTLPSPGPNHALQLLVLERIEPAKNCQRFYVLSLSASLFGDVALTREWGRLGRRGCSTIALFADDISARESLVTWLRRKQKRGYTPVLSIEATARLADR
jgi:predicted DNA-binding WGR domain protein